MTQTWKTVRIFISSTFRDMHAERDYLNRFVFPELRSRCQKQGIEFVGLDLRWGVTEEEVEQHGALESCLNEIKKCNFFISLLGDRYGWIPPPDEIPQEFYQSSHKKVDLTNEDAIWLDEWYRLDETVEPTVYRLRNHKVPIDIAEKLIDFWEKAKLPHASDSITALEIMHGALESTNPETRAFFYFRKPGIYTHPHYPESLVPIFAEQDPHRKNKLTQLKQLIRNWADGKTIIREYNAEYTGLRIDPTFLHSDLGSNELETLKNGVIQPQDWPTLSHEVQNAIETHGIVALSDMDELGKQITEDLWAAIENKLERSIEPSGVSNWKQTYNERFLKERNRLFLGRQDILESMLGYVVDTDDRQPLVITGKSGCGKSALMAECAKQCREKYPKTLVIPHFIGAAPGSTDLSTSIRFICEILRHECNIDDEFSTDPNKLNAQMRLFLEMAGAIRPIILLIDAVNQLEPANHSHELRWLPLNVPSGVKVIVSTLAGDCLDQLQERVLDDYILDVPVLPEIDRKSLIQKQLANRGKKLTEKQIFSILDTTARPDAGLPLYLLVALEELCLFGDYDALNHRIDRLPSTLSELFDQVLQRLEDDHTLDITEFILRLLAVSRSGLMESEILDILAKDGKDIPNLKWTQFYRSLEFYLRPMDETTGVGLIDFYHDTLRFAVYRRYLDMTSPEASETSIFRLSNNQLADYFMGLASGKDEPSKWSTNHPRSLNELPYHLVEAGRKDELRNILFDFNWLQTKLEAIDVNSIIRDYDYLPDDHNASLVQNAIRMSAHLLILNKMHLRSQLYGRLISQEAHEIRNILDQIKQCDTGCWLRPLTASLMPPGGPLIRTLQGHTDSINAVTVIPDGSRVISASSDKTLKVWDMETGEELQSLQGHTDLVRGVVVMPNGRRAISASSDKTLKVWDLETGEELQTLQGHNDWVYAVAVTPDGSHAISASADKTLKVWDMETWEELQTLNGHTDSVYAVAVTPDGSCAISASRDKTLKVWDIKSGEELQKLKGHTNSVYAVAVTPDGCCVISASADKTLKVWDMETGEELQTLKGHNGSVRAIAVTPDGCNVISVSEDETVKVWDIETGEELQTLRGHTQWICGVAVTPDGRNVISASHDKTLKVWDIEAGEELQTMQHHTQWIWGVAVTPDGSRVISASVDKTLKIWDMKTGEQLQTLKGHKDLVRAVVVMPDGRHAISTSHDKTLKIWDLKTGEELQTLKGHAHWVYAVALTPDGSRAISASHDKTLKIWDIKTGKHIKTLKGHTERVLAVAVMPDGNRAISASEDKTVKVWDMETGKQIKTLQGHTKTIYAVAVTPDGRHAISASRDQTLKVWDIETGKQIKTLHGHTDSVRAVVVMPDGRRMISVSSDKTLKIWDMERMEELVSFSGEGSLLSCAVLPNSKTIVAAGTSGRLHFLRLEGVE